MRVRIGTGLGTRTAVNGPEFRDYVQQVQDLGFDSLWLSERVGGPAPDPVVAMSYAAGCTDRLKFGMSVMVLPGRNPVLTAKALASLDRMSGGRLLPAFGLGVRDEREQQAFGVDRQDRAPWFDEALPLMRRLWSGEPVTHRGDRFHLDAVTVQPTPQQDPLEVWMGGIAPSELRRAGRLGDGWLPSFCTPDEVASGIDTINQVAAEHGRDIDPGHMGALVAYCHDEVPEPFAEFVSRRGPGLDPAQLIPPLEHLADRIRAFVDAGATKFVVLPLIEPDKWDQELPRLAEVVLGLQE